VGGNNQQACGWFTPGLLEGAEAASPDIHKAQGRRILPLVGLCGARFRGRGVGGLYTGIDRAGQEVVLVTPQDQVAANSLARGQRRMNQAEKQQLLVRWQGDGVRQPTSPSCPRGMVRGCDIGARVLAQLSVA